MYEKEIELIKEINQKVMAENENLKEEIKTLKQVIKIPRLHQKVQETAQLETLQNYL